MDPHSYTCTSSPAVDIPRHCGASVTAGEHELTCVITRSPQFIFGVTLEVAHSTGLDESIMAHVPYCSVVWKSSMALKLFFALLGHCYFPQAL